jgi:hypothetical protein
MEFIDYQSLNERKEALHQQWHSATPFHYIVFENFFTPEAAELILKNYPTTTEGGWNHYLYQSAQ